MNETISSIGLIVIVLGFAAKALFDWFGKRNLQNSDERLKAVEAGHATIKTDLAGLSKKLEIPTEQIKDLWQWHNQTDQDGVKVWYVRKSLEEALNRNADSTEILARNGEMQTRLLQEMLESNRAFHQESLKGIREIQKG